MYTLLRRNACFLNENWRKKKKKKVIIEEHLQHQRDLFHNFLDFKKAFNMSGMQACGRSSEASTQMKD